METTLNETGAFERVLTVHLDAAELDRAEERAARRLSRDLKIKGFRPGKAPRRIVESMVGSERLRSEALEDSLAPLVTEALDETGLIPAVAPAVIDTRETDDGLEVDVRVTLWPTLEEMPGYEGRTVVLDPLEATEDELAAQIERLRDQYAELEEAIRPADDGDYVTVDLTATRNGLPLEDVAAKDLDYPLGSDSWIPGLDEALRGSSPGEIRKFSAELPAGTGERAGDRVEIQVLVKAVRAKRLPEVTDEWVADVSELESVDELRAELRESIRGIKSAAAASELQARLLDQLLDEVDIDLPEALVGAEMENALHRFLHRLEGQGIDLRDYLEATGQDEEELAAGLRAQSEQNLKTRILLEAVADAENIEVESEEIDETIAALAVSAEVSPDEYRRRLEGGGHLEGLVGDILRQKAFDRLVERASPVDPDGNPIAFDESEHIVTGTIVAEDQESDDPESAEVAE